MAKVSRYLSERFSRDGPQKTVCGLLVTVKDALVPFELLLLKRPGRLGFASNTGWVS